MHRRLLRAEPMTASGPTKLARAGRTTGRTVEDATRVKAARTSSGTIRAATIRVATTRAATIRVATTRAAIGMRTAAAAAVAGGVVGIAKTGVAAVVEAISNATTSR
jgi:hypothetical protein